MIQKFIKEEIDSKVAWICLVSTLCLVFIRFTHLPSSSELERLCLWASQSFFFYLIIPALVIKLIFKQDLASYGFKLKGSLKNWQLYLAMFIFMLPIIYICSRSPSFQSHYPFYRLAAGESWYPNLLIWELFYLLQFIGLEFFFRGFMVHGLKERFGIHAILIMVIPYCMIHFNKPFLECLGSIIAGLLLGYLSYRNRSVMLGIAIHYGVALTMDISALLR
ncbi:MAG: CPBP family intramembrane metalloprotease [Deltaproteobacteria bacterium]|nr:CPBP family intramembrane metalloprotease [Deltaproteobacteria bacterium]